MSQQQHLEELFDTLGQLRKLLVSQTQESHEERAATAMQFAALKFLSGHFNATVGDVAAHMQLSKSSATQLSDRLVKAGYITRSEDSDDRRVVRLQLTAAGQQQLQTIKQHYLDKLGRVLGHVPEADLIELIRIHRTLINTIQEEPK